MKDIKIKKMALKPIFLQLENIFSGSLTIECHVRSELQRANTDIDFLTSPTTLSPSFRSVMERSDAHHICKLINDTPFDWAPPKTSNDPLYIEHSKSKVHIELLGPDGLVRSDKVRLGLYGMTPNSEYGLRTHPAEELYIMLAGDSDWKRGNEPYKTHHPGEQSYHPSMMPHASRTRKEAFFSVYAWYGDISTENYNYQGLPSSN